MSWVAIWMKDLDLFISILTILWYLLKHSFRKHNFFRRNRGKSGYYCVVTVRQGQCSARFFKATKALMIHSAETWLKNLFSPVQVQFLDFTLAFFSQWLRRLIRDEIYWLIMRVPARDLVLRLCFWLWQSIGQEALLLLFPGGFFVLVNFFFFFSCSFSSLCSRKSLILVGHHLAKILACEYHRFQMLLYFTTTTSSPHCSKAREALVYNLTPHHRRTQME
jgi:hypothetical protein